MTRKVLIIIIISRRDRKTNKFKDTDKDKEIDIIKIGV